MPVKIVSLLLFFNVIMLLITSISYAENMPDWILQPEVAGYSYCATGFAKKDNNLSLQKKIARMNAMSEISKNISVSIDNTLEINTDVTSKNNKQTDVNKNISSSSRQSSDAIFNNIEEIDSFLDNSSGIYYLRACIK